MTSQPEDERPPESEEPQVFDVQKNLDGDWKFNRRNFLTAAGATAAAAALAGCGSGDKSEYAQQMAQPATLVPTFSPEQMAWACGGFQAFDSTINALAVSADGTLLAAAANNVIKLWDLAGESLLKTLQDHTSSITTLTFTPDGKFLISGGRDNFILVWSLPDGTMLQNLEDDSDTPNAMAVTPDGSILAVAMSGGIIKLWSLSNGELLHTLQGHTADDLTITPDGNLLVSAGVDHTIKMWSLPEGNLIKTLEGHTNIVTSLAVNGGGTMLASGSTDNNILLWSLPDGQQVNILTGHLTWVSDVKITPDGTLLVSASDDKTIRLWPLPGGQPCNTRNDGITATIDVIALSPDGKHLFSGDRNGRILIRELPMGNVQNCLMDAEISEEPEFFTGIKLESGTVVKQPCGSAIPAGATCICNCVTAATFGVECGCVGHHTEASCSCDKVCTCDTVCACVGACSCDSKSSGSSGGHYWHPN